MKPRTFVTVKLFFLLALLAVLVFPSCSKKENQGQHLDNSFHLKTEFFEATPGTDPAVTRLINYLKQKESHYHFVQTFAAKNGYPQWGSQ